jgi:hypothetical protein
MTHKWGRITSGGGRDPKSSPRGRRLIVSVVGVVVIAGIAIVMLSPSHKLEPVDTERIRQEFSRIVPFESAHLISGPEMQERRTSASLAAKYKAAASTATVAAYYRAQLAHQGWSYHGPFTNGSNWGEDYCKDGMLGSLEFLGNETDGHVDFDVSVNRSTKSERDCSR